jgi:hypothetical protein
MAASAACAGALEICMSPRNGLFNSMIRKIAPDTARSDDDSGIQPGEQSRS